MGEFGNSRGLADTVDAQHANTQHIGAQRNAHLGVRAVASQRVDDGTRHVRTVTVRIQYGWRR